MTALTRANLERLAEGRPMKMLRGRLGIWLPGQDPLPLQDIHPARYRGEDAEASLVVSLVSRQPWAADLFHIPNGGHRFAAEAKRLKAQGVRAGVSDFFLSIPAGGRHGLWVELKASDGSLTDLQREWLEKKAAQGYGACAAYGADAAVEAMVRYARG
jgi:VRR-NUC domain